MERPAAPRVPLTPAEQLVRPLVRFLHVESASGIVLLACTVVALGLANSPAAATVEHFWHTPVSLTVGGFTVGGELGHFVVNDVLMTVFFFVVGLEIKRELVAGELREPRKAALPVIAALGGMLVPAGVYVLAHGTDPPGARGWGVPMATDIAFVVGAMALLGKRVPFGLKIMILSLAIADDIGAVVVIAAFYSTGLSWPMLGLVAAGFVLTYLLNRAGVRAVPVYVAVGIAVWLFALQSGIHVTVAGVVFGLLTPAGTWMDEAKLVTVMNQSLTLVQNDPDLDEHDRTGAMSALAYAAREAVSPLHRLESALHPWVGFGIMPLFALANAGVPIDGRSVGSSVAIAVALGLAVGKPVGIVGACWIAVKLRVARLPEGVTWPVLIGGGCLAGIGFTMSLFVAGLALEPDALSAGKAGTIVGSFVSAVAGCGILLVTLRKR